MDDKKGTIDAAATIRTLFEISNAVNNTENLDDLYKSIHFSLNKILNLENFAIVMYHAEKDSITFPYVVDEMDKDPGEVFDISRKKSLTARVIHANRPLIFYEEDIMRMAAGQPESLLGAVCKVWAGAPLKLRNRPFGALIVQNYHSRDAFKKEDLDLLNSVAEFIAVSIERKQVQVARKQSDEINRVLLEITGAVHSSENLHQLFETIHQSLSRIMDVSNFYIGLYERETGKISFPFFQDEYDELTIWDVIYLKTNSLTNEVLQGLKPVLLKKADLDVRAAEKRILGTVPLIWLGIPLIAKNEPIGVMVTQSYSDPELFDQRDLDILNSVSAQIAMAIERRQSEEKNQQSERLARTLFRISNAVNTTEKLDELYQSIYDALNQLIPLPNFFICIVEEEKKRMHFPLYIDEYDQDSLVRSVQYDENSRFITVDVINSKKPLFLDKAALEKRHRSNKATGTMSVIWLGVPLMIRGRVIGVMTVQHYTDPQYFKKKDLDLFMAVSDQIALAIDRKRSQEIILAHKQNLEIEVAQRTGELHQTMEKLSESEKHFRETIELLPEMVFETDEKFNMIYANQKAYELFRYTREDLEAGIAAIDIITPQDRQRAAENMIKSISGEKIKDKEYLVQRKDGTVFPAIIESLPIFTNGQYAGMRGVIVDMTAQKEIQKDREAMAAAEKEMEIARNIQMALLPSLEKFKDASFDMAANMTPAEEVGGDYYDVICSTDNKLWFGIGDVTGHGLVSGLVMMMAQVSINTLIQSIPDLTPAQVLIYSNRILQANIREGLKVDHHMTISFMVEEKEGFYKYAGAHEIILIFRAHTRTVERIPTKGMWLGILPDISKPTLKYAGEFRLEKDDILFLYTDGVIEICNHNREQYDIDRLESFLLKNGQNPPDRIKANLLSELDTYMDRQLDDITFLIMKKR